MSDIPQHKIRAVRASNLTGRRRRTELARDAARQRWNGPSGGTIRHSIDEGVLDFAGMQFRCAVLDDETRVISGTEFMRVMGMYRSGSQSTRRSEDDEFYFPLYLTFKNLRPFILEDEKLIEFLRYPVRYRGMSGSVGEGIAGQALRRICSVWVRAQAAGVLGPSQSRVAAKAEILLEALADVAIDSLIDEATGYQKRRAHDALQKILAAYISPELLPWQQRFPNSFYEQLYRVMGWKYDASSTARTAYVGKLTNLLIYEKLPPGVLDELRKKNPVLPQRKWRRNKHFQFLSGNVGHPHLQNQITAVTTLLRATPSGNWRFFKNLFTSAFPPPQGELFSTLELEKLSDIDA